MKPSSISAIMSIGKVVTAEEGRMTAFEIRRSYAEAKYPKEQIKILAQLNLCTQADIKAIVEHKTDELPPLGSKPRRTRNRKPRVPPEVWQEIKKKYESGEYTQKQLAKMYGMSQTTICNNISKTWKSVDPHDKDEQPATDLREGAEKNERPPVVDPVQSVYELAAELVEYIGQKYHGVDQIGFTKDENGIHVHVEHGGVRVEITQRKAVREGA